MSFKLQSIKEEVTQLNEQVYKKCSVAYLNKYVACPIIDEDKSMFLYGLLKQSKYPHLQSAYIAVMLVDLALSLHEAVPINNEHEGDVKHRQLTVLGGDYYSSLYYNELAKIDDLNLIKNVARAIQEINEQKMNVYLQRSDVLEDYLKGIEKINAYLFASIANELKCPEWSQFVASFFLLKVLIMQRNNIIDVKVGHKKMIDQNKENIDVKIKDLTKKVMILLQSNLTLHQLFSDSFKELQKYENRLVNATGEGL
ncbi:heptaprenyl diphosphate synthase component 1 [Lottiidibacillus patelloidae]|nr:heptaprenyl diphosphate synthase component 1 [Lottiidibacillus patelloidae]